MNGDVHCTVNGIPTIVENLQSDTCTGQAILFKTNFIGRGQIKIVDEAGFSDIKSVQLLPHHLRKKKNQGFIYCLNDRIRFERKGRCKLFRDELFHSDIEFIYFFSNITNVIMFGLVDRKDGKLIYETYSVNSMEDRNKISKTTQNVVLQPYKSERSHPNPSKNVVFDNDDLFVNHNRSTLNGFSQNYSYSSGNLTENPRPNHSSQVSVHKPTNNSNHKLKLFHDTQSPNPKDYVVFRNKPHDNNNNYQSQKTRPIVAPGLSTFYPRPESTNMFHSSDSINSKSDNNEGPLCLYVQRKTNTNPWNNQLYKSSSHSNLSIYR